MIIYKIVNYANQETKIRGTGWLRIDIKNTYQNHESGRDSLSKAIRFAWMIRGPFNRAKCGERLARRNPLSTAEPG